MRFLPLSALVLTFWPAGLPHAAEPQPEQNPADHLPPHIRRVTGFGHGIFVLDLSRMPPAKR